MSLFDQLKEKKTQSSGRDLPSTSFTRNEAPIQSISDDAVRTTVDRSYAPAKQSALKYLGAELAEGFTFGIYDNDYKPESFLLKASGVTANLIGGAVASYLAVTGLGAAGVGVGAAAKSAKAVTTAQKAFKAAKMQKAAATITGEVAPSVGKAFMKYAGRSAYHSAKEGAILGTAVGAAKSQWQGESFSDTLANAVTEGTQWAAAGAVLTPVMAGAGEFITRRGFQTQKKMMSTLYESPSGKALVKNISDKSKAPTEVAETALGDASTMLGNNVKTMTGENAGMVSAGVAAKRIKALKPISEFEALANPEMLKKAYGETMESAGNNFFKENSFGKWVYQADENIKELVDNKRFSEAFDAVHSATLKQVKDDKNLSSYLASPFFQTAASLKNAKVEKFILTNQKYSTFPDLPKILNNYSDTMDVMGLQSSYGVWASGPEEAIQSTVSAATAMKPVGKRAVFPNLLRVKNLKNQKLIKAYDKAVANGDDDLAAQITNQITELKDGKLKYRITKKNLNDYHSFDPRLKKEEVVNIVDETIISNLKAIAGDASIIDFGKMKDTDAIIKGLTLFNRQFGQSLMQSFNRVGDTLDDTFGHTTNEIRPIAQKLLRKSIFEQDIIAQTKQLTTVSKQLRLPGLTALQTHDLNNQKIDIVAAINRRSKEIDVLGLEGTDAKLLDEAQKVVSNMFKPGRETLSASYKGDADPLAVHMDRYFPKDGNTYLKENSEMADYLHGMLASGVDMPDQKRWSIFNAQRHLNRFFGANNPVSKFIFNDYKKRSIDLDGELDIKLKDIQSLGIKKGSPLSDMVMQLGEGRITEIAPEFQALSGADQEKVKLGVSKINGIFEELFDRINVVNKFHGLPSVNKRANYFHHMNVGEDLGEQISLFLKGEVKPDNGEFVLRPITKTVLDAKKTFMGAERMRAGGEYVSDAIGSVEKYLKPALERIYFQDLVSRVDSTKWLAPAGVTKFLQNFKENYLLNTSKLAANERENVPKIVLDTFETLRNRTSKAVLLGSASTMLTQLFSAPLNMAISGKAGLKAMVASTSKEGAELWALSKNNKMRNALTAGFDMKPDLIDAAAKGMNSFLKKGFSKVGIGGAYEKGTAFTGNMLKKWEGFTEKSLAIFDSSIAKHAFLTGYYKAAASGAEKDAAIRFGDYWAGVTQAEMSKIGSPEFMRSVIGRSLSQYQSFSINLFSSLLDDLPRFANSDNASAAVSTLLKAYAGISLTNEVLGSAGIPPAFDSKSFIPFISSAKFGLPGPFGAAMNAVKSATSDRAYEVKKAKSDVARYAAMSLGIPGTAQAFRIAKGFGDKKLANQYEGDKMKSFFNKIAIGIYGSSIKYERKKYNKKIIQDRKERNNSSFGKSLKELIN